VQNRIAKEGLTVKEIDAAIKEKCGPRRQPGAGRPPKRPKKLKDAFTHLTSQVQKFVKLNDAVWFGNDYDIVTEIKEVPADKLAELKAQIGEAIEQCENLAATASKDAKALRGTLPEIERRMKAQAKLDAQIRAAIEEEDKTEDEAQQNTKDEYAAEFQEAAA
jgi:hypothetical protein